jgi:hypothetical protein
VRPREREKREKGEMRRVAERYSFLEERTIQVAIVPIAIDESKFAFYSALIRSLAVVDLRDVTRVQTRWKTGRVVFNFYEYRAPRSEWEEFQAYRKTVGVIGIGDCGNASGLAELNSAFEAIVAQYPTAAHRRLLAVDPPETQLDGVLGDAVVVPTKLGLDHTTVIVQSHVSELTAKILIGHERDVYIADLPGAYIATHLDSCKTGDEVKVVKRKKPLRAAKTRGDLCIQAGQSESAFAFYGQAVEEGKILGDWEWVAGALEGQCAALVALNERSPEVAEEEIMTKASEALTYYNRRGASVLVLELHLKVAHYQAVIGHKEKAAEWLITAHTLAENSLET